MFTDFGKKNTLHKLVTMATRKRLFLIFEIENFANTQLWKVTKFGGNRSKTKKVINRQTKFMWKTPPPSANRVNMSAVFLFQVISRQAITGEQGQKFCKTLPALFERRNSGVLTRQCWSRKTKLLGLTFPCQKVCILKAELSHRINDIICYVSLML